MGYRIKKAQFIWSGSYALTAALLLTFLLSANVLAAVRVTAATPANVPLIPDRAVTITIQGTELDQVQSAGVFLRNRQPVPDIAVSYRAVSTTTAEIILRARKADLPGPVVLVLSSRGRPVARVPVNLTVQRATASTAGSPAWSSSAPPQPASRSAGASSATTSPAVQPAEPIVTAQPLQSQRAAAAAAVTSPSSPAVAGEPPATGGAAVAGMVPKRESETPYAALSESGPLKIDWVRFNGLEAPPPMLGPEVNITFGYLGDANEFCIGVMGEGKTTDTCFPGPAGLASNGLRYDVLGAAASIGHYPNNDLYVLWFEVSRGSESSPRQLKTITVRRPQGYEIPAEAVSQNQSAPVVVGRPPLDPNTGGSYVGGSFGPRGLGTRHRTSCNVVLRSPDGHPTTEGVLFPGGFGGIRAIEIAAGERISSMRIYCSNGARRTVLADLNPFAAFSLRHAECPQDYEINGFTVRINATDVGGGVHLTSGIGSADVLSIPSISCVQRKHKAGPMGPLVQDVYLHDDGVGALQTATCKRSDVVHYIDLMSRGFPGGGGRPFQFSVCSSGQEVLRVGNLGGPRSLPCTHPA